MQTVLVTGANGQLGWELSKTCPSEIRIVALTRKELDIADIDQVERVFAQHNPIAVINAAAYTAVDKAESESKSAYHVNQNGGKNLAQAAYKNNAYLLHISTDFVFDGESNIAYTPESQTNPLGVYGASKLAGERAIAETFDNFCIIRTAWVYSCHGSNFVKTMLRLMRDKPALNVVADQIGSPTWANGLALACWQAISKQVRGVYHWSDAGVASWYDFAVAIQRLGVEKGLLEKMIPIHPIPTSGYPTPAKRPTFSLLDKTKILAALPELELKHWEYQLSTMLDALKNSNT